MPICRRVCSTTELRLTLERRPKQNLKLRYNFEFEPEYSDQGQVPVCIAGISKAIYSDAGLRGVESLPYSCIEFVIGNRTPKGRLIVGHRLRLQRDQGVVRRGRSACCIRCLITHG